MRLDSYAENLGDVRIHTPSQTVTAGSRFPMDVVYRVGPTPITAGGAIRFRLPGLYAGDGKIRAPFRSSREEGVELRAANALPPVNGKNGEEFFAVNWYFFVVVEEGELHPGDTVTVSYGQVGTTRGRFPTWAQKWAVEVAVDPDGTRAAPRSGFYLLPEPPHIEIVPDVPEKLELTIPSTIRCGEAVRAVLRARDHYRNVVTGYESCFETKLLREDTAQPRELEFALNEEGILFCDNLVFPDSGIYRVEVTDRDLGLRAVSNPARVTDASPSPRLFWGDTHCHSIASGDTTINSEFITPEHDYRYARYVSDLDFCMVTDHSQDLCAAPEDWDMVREAARDAYEPGRFVTFSAYESTHHPQRQDGDKNIYFLDDSQPCVPEGTTEETYAVLKKNSGEKVMVIPHLHVPTNWEKHDPELEHVVE
ncbi:MAG: DUF3604 domain-containing protein, partial [Planctomycetes bacterium]|nr:DUF3604 domain-containing protein [Planctomycetota bacterium]